MVRWGLLAFERSGLVVWAMAMAGFAMAIAGVVAFRRVRTTVDPFDPEKTTALVTTGVYSWSRSAGRYSFRTAWPWLSRCCSFPG